MTDALSRWLGRLSVGKKLMLIYLLDLTAVIFVSGILIHEKFLSIDFTRKEIVGAAYTEVVRSNLMAVFGPASEASSDPLRALTAVRDAHDDLLRTHDVAERFREALQPVPLGAGGGVPDRGVLLAAGRELLTTVGNQSNLILDPDLDSYYVMSLVVLRYPELLQVLHDSAVFMERAGAPLATGNRAAELLTLAGRLEAVLVAMEADYNQAWIAGDAALQAALAPERTALVAQARAYLARLQAVAGAEVPWPDAAAPGPTAQARAEALQALSLAWQGAVVELDR
ncbi:MAG: sensor domain-containing diguanylate cyclase, partial [Burkholderiaceae bacterium]|nr:sensor domain-containing diguanylate cyclase [Burkholderiaceae bacterium]